MQPYLGRAGSLGAAWERTEALDYEGGTVVKHTSRRWTGMTALMTDIRCTGAMQVELGSDCIRLSAVLEEGGGRVEIDARGDNAPKRPYCRNPISLVPAGGEARVRTTNVRQMRHLVLQFDGSTVTELFDEPVDLAAAFRARPTISDITLLNLCRLFGAECDKERSGGRLVGESLFVALLLRLTQLNGCTTRSAATGGLAPWQLRRVVDYLEAHFGEDVSLETLAELVRLSVTHFSRAFKQSTAVSPHRWLVDLRCSKAKQLLLDESMGLAEIASATGFSDQSHFTRVFGRAHGHPPATWRRAQIASEAASLSRRGHARSNRAMSM